MLLACTNESFLSVAEITSLASDILTANIGRSTGKQLRQHRLQASLDRGRVQQKIYEKISSERKFLSFLKRRDSMGWHRSDDG